MSSIALKFTSLLVRTLSKPIANTIKSQAKQHPRFRTVCISFAQFMHRSDVHLRMKLLGEDNIKVRPLNDVKAIDNGATFLSESFIFSVAGGLILFESYRSRRKELARRESVADDIKALQDEIEWLKTRLEQKNILNGDKYQLPQDVKPLILKQKLEADRASVPISPPYNSTASSSPLDNQASTPSSQAPA